MTLKELEEFCNGLGFDGKIGQCFENALYCDLGLTMSANCNLCTDW